MTETTSGASEHEQRMSRARAALDGLSVGDAFGELFFFEGSLAMVLQRAIPARGWHTTDDTEMAAAIVDVLGERRAIDRDRLAATFAYRHRLDPARGYGGGAKRLLASISEGGDWRSLASGLFPGGGSFGNGGAMRVAPLGAYFADASDEVIVAQAEASAEVTHAHPEGRAGAIAIALASAYAWRTRNQVASDPTGLLRWVYERTPAGCVRDKLASALALREGTVVSVAAQTLGSGAYLSAQDTVPFCLWVASRWLHSYEEALWHTVEGLGDRDTTCAIVGGIVACRVGREGIPAAWLARREPLRMNVLPPEAR